MNTPVLGGKRRRETATAIARRGYGRMMDPRDGMMAGNNRRMQTLGRGNLLVERGTRNRSTLDRGRPINGDTVGQQMGGHDNGAYNINGSFTMMNHFSPMTGGPGGAGMQQGGGRGDSSSSPYLRNVMSEDL